MSVDIDYALRYLIGGWVFLLAAQMALYAHFFLGFFVNAAICLIYFYLAYQADARRIDDDFTERMNACFKPVQKRRGRPARR